MADATADGGASPPMARVEALLTLLRGQLSPVGMEVAPLLVDWYNEKLALGSSADKFSIDAAPGTVAFIVASDPTFFEHFASFYAAADDDELPRSDPVDRYAASCIRAAVDAVVDAGAVLEGIDASAPDKPALEELGAAAAGAGEGSGSGGIAAGLGVRVLSEGWNYAKSQPFVLVQTAGHEAGVARLYQEKDLTDTAAVDAWKAARRAAGKHDKVFPVAVHPRWGGWFAFRAVIVVDGLTYPDMPRPDLPDPLPTDEGRSAALIKFGEGWSDRDLPTVEPCEREYSDDAKVYFGFMAPKEDKVALLARIRGGGRGGKGASSDA